MNINLLSPVLAFLLCAAITALATYLFAQFDARWYHRIFPFVVAGAFVLAAALHFAAGVITQMADELPSELWLMVMPFALSVSLLIGIVVSRFHKQVVAKGKRKKRKRFLQPVKAWHLYVPAGLLVVGSFVFSFVLINSYYQYYPNLSSLVGDNRLFPVGANHVDLQYINPRPGLQHTSIEASLSSAIPPSQGKVFSITIPGTVSHFNARKAFVYEPPIALARSYVQLPVLILLAGLPGNPQDWLNGGSAQATLDAFAKQHDGITPMVFMVDNLGSLTNDTECVDSPRGNVETYLTVDVPNYIKNNFNVSRQASHWAIGGLSLGGTCGIMLTLRHPDVYHYFLDFGGDMDISIGAESGTIAKLFHGSKSEWAAHQPSLLLAAPGAKNNYQGLGGYFATGRSDSLSVTAAARQLYLESRKDNLDVAYESVGGQHTFAVWQQNFSDALPWLSNRLGATECTTGCSN
jgi:S-formylglutathione hydrolase FrmB